MCEEHSYQIINTTAVNQSCLLLLLEVCKIHYKKENISVGSSAQRKNALF